MEFKDFIIYFEEFFIGPEFWPKFGRLSFFFSEEFFIKSVCEFDGFSEDEKCICLG
jgi:hypothetical protein